MLCFVQCYLIIYSFIELCSLHELAFFYFISNTELQELFTGKMENIFNSKSNPKFVTLLMQTGRVIFQSISDAILWASVSNFYCDR